MFWCRFLELTPRLARRSTHCTWWTAPAMRRLPIRNGSGSFSSICKRRFCVARQNRRETRAFFCLAANSFGLMNVLILAAGYATRLYPLTLNKAKPLLVVGGKPIIEWLGNNLGGIQGLETIYVVTNDKFTPGFQAWSQAYQKRHPEFKFKVINDGSTSDDDKLGAIGDINFVVTHENLSQTGLLVAAGDNLFTNSMADFVAHARNTEVTVAVYDVG